MIESRTQTITLSLKEPNQANLPIAKKYRCDCCKGKHHRDYNRQNRLRRESASSKRLSATHKTSTRYASQQNCLNIANTVMVSSVRNGATKEKQVSSPKKLPAILQSPQMVEKLEQEDKKGSQKQLNLDMKQYYKSLFPVSRPKRAINRIEVLLEGEKFVVEFDSSQKMKLALGELKLLIKNT